MSERNWNDLLEAQQAKGKFVCVGLDTDIGSPKFPASHLGSQVVQLHGGPYVAFPQMAFNCAIVSATKDVAGCYKINLAFYKGQQGKQDLKLTIAYINEVAPEIPVILDAKWGDIGNTNDGYVDELGNYYGADAVTIHNYMGLEAMKPFLDQWNKGVIVLCRTSNPGSDEFQCAEVRLWTDNNGGLYPSRHALLEGRVPTADNQPYHVIHSMYQYVADRVATEWNYNGNCAVVVGATYADVELKSVRQIVGDMPILLPGIGAQGGDLEQTVANGHNSQGQGMIVNSSRGIIFASDGPDFAERAAEETVKLHEGVTRALVAASPDLETSTTQSGLASPSGKGGLG